MVSDSYGYKKIEIESKRISSTTSQLHTGFYGVSTHCFTGKTFQANEKTCIYCLSKHQWRLEVALGKFQHEFGILRRLGKYEIFSQINTFQIPNFTISQKAADRPPDQLTKEKSLLYLINTKVKIFASSIKLKIIMKFQNQTTQKRLESMEQNAFAKIQNQIQ